MATSETTNLQLVKYGAGTDNFIRTDYNGNLDKIDTFAGNTNQAIANVRTYRIRASFTVTTGNAVLHFPGTGTANMGSADKDVRSYIPTGGTLVAIIPGQTSRNYGQDYAFVTLSDQNNYSVRVIGTPNQEYTCICDILYNYST